MKKEGFMQIRIDRIGQGNGRLRVICQLTDILIAASRFKRLILLI
jgi:hypothetical protein